MVSDRREYRRTKTIMLIIRRTDRLEGPRIADAHVRVTGDQWRSVHSKSPACHCRRRQIYDAKDVTSLYFVTPHCRLP